MINVTLMGGLGNQMFQYALGRSLQLRGREVTYRRRDLPDGNEATPHKFNTPFYGLDGLRTKVTFGDPHGPHIEDTKMLFRQDVYDAPETCILTGHWQTEKYFTGAGSVLREEFIPVDLPENIRLSGEFVGKGAVAMHVRRGDYVGMNETFHGLMPVSYYQEALAIVRAKNPDIRVLIYSDDPAWCHDNLPGKIIVTNNRFWDLYLMSRAEHIIIANSSYSWWSAWIGDGKPGRIVVAPKKWFVTTSVESADIVPDRWVKI